MTILRLALETSFGYWFLILAGFVLLFAGMIVAIQEICVLRRGASAVVVTGSYIVCFAGLLYTIMRNQTLACITNPYTCWLLVTLVLYAAYSICLFTLCLLATMLKTMRSRRLHANQEDDAVY